MICAWLWLSTFLLYQTINQYEIKHKTFQNQYYEEILGFTIDVLGYISSGLIFARLLKRKKFLFYIAFGIAATGVIGCIATRNDPDGNKDLIGIIFLYIGQFGIAAAYQGCFVIMEIFPSIIYSFTIGVCNLLGVTSTIVALFAFPLMNDPTYNIRLAICATLILIACILVPLLKGSHYILI